MSSYTGSCDHNTLLLLESTHCVIIILSQSYVEEQFIQQNILIEQSH